MLSHHVNKFIIIIIFIINKFLLSLTKNMLAAQRLSFDNGLMSISPIIAHMPANTMMAALTGVN